MINRPEPAPTSSYKSFARAASAITIMVGSLVLLGWALDIPVLKSDPSGLIGMKAITALAFTLSGLALWLLLRERITQQARVIVQLFAFIIALLGLLTLCEYIFGWQLGIDQWLFKDLRGDVGNLTPGRMSPTTALNFLFLGTAFLLLDRETPLGNRTAQFLGLLISLLSSLALLGYLYDAIDLYDIEVYNQIALGPALTFIIISAGLLCAFPDSGPMSIITSESAGSLMARRLLPVAIVVPVILGWVSLQGLRAGLYDVEVGLALVVSASIAVFVIVIGWSASGLNSVDVELKREQAAGLRQSEERLRYVIWATRDAVWDRNLATGEIWWNEGLKKLFHYGDDEIEPSTAWWEQHIHPEDRGKVVRSIQTILDTRQDLWSKEYRFQRADGSYANIFDRGYILYDQQTGQPQRMIGAMADFTEQKTIQKALRQSEELFAKAFSASPAGITITQPPDNRYIEVNDSFLKIIEYRRGEVLGHTSEELGVISVEDRGRILQELKEQGTVRDLETRVRTKSGQLRVVLISLEQIELEGIPSILSITYDITERKQMEEKFTGLLESAPDALVIVDGKGQICIVNSQAEKLFGYKRDELYGQAIEILIPHRFRDRHPAHRKTYFLDPKTRAMGAGLELYGVRKDGSEFPIDISLSPLNTGKEALATAAIRDISERKQAEEALYEINEKLTVGLAELDQRNREIVYLNELSNLLQTCQTPAEAYAIINESVPRLFPELSGALYMINADKNLVEAVAVWKTLLPKEHMFAPGDCLALQRGRTHFVAEGQPGQRCRHIANSPSSHICIPMAGQDDVLGMFHLQCTGGHSGPTSTVQAGLRPIEQGLAETVADTIALALTNLRLRETLRNESIRDALTGLFNRRFMEESLEREMRQATRSQRPLGIIMLDLDNFKDYNDTFGHAGGDTLLRELGSFLKLHIRGGDIACRYGGDEFLLLLPEASLEVAHKRAEQLREGIQHIQVRHQGELLGIVTLSLGVAAFPEHGQEAEEVVRAADTALYRAKHKGRNQLVVAKRARKPAGR